MAFVEITASGINLTKYEDKTLTAYFLGSNIVTTQYGDQLVHTFMKADNSRVRVYGFGALNKKLSEISIGVYLRVTYIGVGKLKTGKYKGKEYHDVKVEADYTNILSDQKLAARTAELVNDDPDEVSVGIEDEIPF